MSRLGNRRRSSLVVASATSGSQVSGKSGVLFDVDSNSGDESPNLTVLESVRCLECGAIYAKPAGGGTVRRNPGCPECGYVGWARETAGVAFSHWWTPPHSDAGRLQHPNG